jgi:FixJ family two-component response regulator
MITGSSVVSMALAVMKAGAVEIIEKPVDEADLLGAVTRAPGLAENASAASDRHDKMAAQIASLTTRTASGRGVPTASDRLVGQSGH